LRASDSTTSTPITKDVLLQGHQLTHGPHQKPVVRLVVHEANLGDDGEG